VHDIVPREQFLAGRGREVVGAVVVLVMAMEHVVENTVMVAVTFDLFRAVMLVVAVSFELLLAVMVAVSFELPLAVMLVVAVSLKLLRAVMVVGVSFEIRLI